MSAGGILRIERTLDAPPQRVFAAWTEPEVLRRWWGAGPDVTSPWVEVDLRVGGRYRLAMTDGRTGADIVVAGDFIEVDPPRRLVYSWRWETPGSPTGDLTTIVTVDFSEPAPGRTLVVLTQRGFTAPGQGAAHEQGWAACLDNLVARVISPRAAS